MEILDVFYDLLRFSFTKYKYTSDGRQARKVHPARRDRRHRQQFMSFMTYCLVFHQLPYKLQLCTRFRIGSEAKYNILFYCKLNI